MISICIILSICLFLVADCIRHWKNLRDRFTREKRNKPTGSEAPESNWPYFEEMSFYNKCSRPRKWADDYLFYKLYFYNVFYRTYTATPRSQGISESIQSSSSCSSPAWSTIDVPFSPSDEGDIYEVTGEGLDEVVDMLEIPNNNTPKTGRGKFSMALVLDYITSNFFRNCKSLF